MTQDPENAKAWPEARWSWTATAPELELLCSRELWA
jgi:hypothetical protein